MCGRAARLVCPACWRHLAQGPGRPLEGPAGLDSLTALFDYDEAVRRIILTAKNDGRRDVLRQLGRALAAAPILDAGGDGRRAGGAFDVITWVPATPENRRRRGFDQGRLLARSVARRRAGRAERLFGRVGQSQKGLDRRQRLEGPGLVLARTPPPRVLLVDDVVTTGASLSTAAQLLRAHGAQSVHGLVVASVDRPAAALATIYDREDSPTRKGPPWR